ncbi:MAG TPA: N-acetylmuramoyl-L-alanine amidase-like domain-containing protein [Longimicrobiales bacterium]|nr:N-acetylmuramoyl-L-alanine amidase-like domain-containing protein [Longimicrobiales bacterium]
MRTGAWILMIGGLALAGCGGDEGAELSDKTIEQNDALADNPAVRGRDIDRRIFEQKLELARTERLDTLPFGAMIVRIGESFLGTRYTPGTLEAEGPEHLVINLEELDCVTYIENVLALARIVRAGEPTWPAFVKELERIRYRDGELDGYASRLHYFSEWISDNESLGLMRNITRDLGGVRLTEAIDFMSTHADLYRQLADSATLAQIREMEARLNEQERWYIPEGDLSEAVSRLENGDIIAATSAIDGLDVAHTGFAVRRRDGVYLMHAPLVGKDVQLSETPIDQRIRRIEAQDGIMVARPL